MFYEFPREIAFPQRRLVFNQEEYLWYINTYNGKRNLHTTVYAYQGVNGRIPIYETAIVKWIYFDFDEKKSHEGAKKLTQFLLDDKIEFAVNLSGGGFHFYIGTKENNVPNIKLSIKTLQEEILNTYNVLKYNDSHVIGNVAQETRITNTYNVRRKRYCIALKPEEVFLSWDEICKIAERQRSFNIWWNEGKKLELPMMESNSSTVNKGIDEIDIMAVEPCIENILKKRNPSHDERFLLCLYLSEEFRKGEDINKVNLDNLCEKIIDYMRELKWSDFCDEPNKTKSTRYQVRNIIMKKMNEVPNCEWRKMRGICPGKCMVSLI